MGREATRELGSSGKESACDAGDPGRSLDQEDPLEKGMATHSSIQQTCYFEAVWTSSHDPHIMGFPGGSVVKNPPTSAGDAEELGSCPAPGWQDLLEKEMAAHSSLLAWRIPGTEEPLGLQSMGSQRVTHN